VTRIGISIDVEDVDRAVAFYRDGLGLRVLESGKGWARMALGEQSFFFGIPWGPEGRIERDHERHWTPVHLDFVVDDFDVAVERAIKAERNSIGQSYGVLSLETWRICPIRREMDSI
jgi:catechol 2,3-dioxygenase-like lactoylglutathione lyase family enzyme